MAKVRIQKVMADNGLCSRRAAEQVIQEGRVKVNGHPVRLGDQMDPAKDLLFIDGERVQLQRKQEYHYLVLNKPRGFVTTTSDELGRKTVMDLVKDCPVRVYPVGRLDKDSEGLLLLTNDGEFANLMMHPSHGVSKLYRVTVRPRATEEQIIKLSEGVTLDDGTVTLPAVINVVVDEPERTVMEMTIREGKNRQIRRMCEAVGLDVIRLRRSAMGVVKLGMLQPGQHRDLTKAELNGLRAAAVKGKARSETQSKQEAAEQRKERRAAAAAKGRPGAKPGARSGAPRSGRPGGAGRASGSAQGKKPMGHRK